MTPAIAINHLVKTYPNGVKALRNISLEIKAGDFFALLGPNGAGKSTTIGILSSLVNKTSGSVVIFGHDLDHDKSAAKKCIGLVPQEFNFNQFEPVEEIVINQAGYYGIPRQEARKRTEKYLRELGLWEKRKQMARSLSGGQKRRLMIARALVHEPKMLILDEPTAGVDIEIRRSMWEFMQKINKEGTTILLTTHYLEEAENLCRNIAIINHGQIVENSSMKNLLSKLDFETIVLDLEEPLSSPPLLDGYPSQLSDSTTLEVTTHRTTSLNDLFCQLENKGIKVKSLRNKANRLEELFLSLINEAPSDSSPYPNAEKSL